MMEVGDGGEGEFRDQGRGGGVLEGPGFLFWVGWTH